MTRRLVQSQQGNRKATRFAQIAGLFLICLALFTPSMAGADNTINKTIVAQATSGTIIQQTHPKPSLKPAPAPQPIAQPLPPAPEAVHGASGLAWFVGLFVFFSFLVAGFSMVLFKRQILAHLQDRWPHLMDEVFEVSVPRDAISYHDVQPAPQANEAEAELTPVYPVQELEIDFEERQQLLDQLQQANDEFRDRLESANDVIIEEYNQARGMRRQVASMNRQIKLTQIGKRRSAEYA